MVQPVLPAPVVIHPFGVRQAVAGAAAYVGDEDGKAVQRQVLDQGHGEPGEIGAFLALRAAVDVEDDRTRSLEAQARRGQVEPRRNAQPVVADEGGIFPRREQLRRDA